MSYWLHVLVLPKRNKKVQKGQVTFQVYLLGNTTDDNFDKHNHTYQNMLNHIDWENENSAILFLGDDIPITYFSSGTNEKKAYKREMNLILFRCALNTLEESKVSLNI